MYSLNNLHQIKEQIEIENDKIIESEFLRIEKLNTFLKLLEKNLKEIDNNYSVSITPSRLTDCFSIKLFYLEENLNEFTTNSMIKLTNEYYSIYRESLLMMKYNYEEEKVKTINFQDNPEEWIVGVESILISTFLEHNQIKRRINELTKKLNKNFSNNLTI